MSERVGKEKIERQPGFLNYIGKDGYVWQVPMGKGKNKDGVKKRVGTEKFDREPGFMYFLDKDGFVSRAPLKNWKPKEKADA